MYAYENSERQLPFRRPDKTTDNRDHYPKVHGMYDACEVRVCALYLIIGEDDRSPGGLHYQGLRHVRNDLNSNHES